MSGQSLFRSNMSKLLTGTNTDLKTAYCDCLILSWKPDPHLQWRYWDDGVFKNMTSLGTAPLNISKAEALIGPHVHAAVVSDVTPPRGSRCREVENHWHSTQCSSMGCQACQVVTSDLITTNSGNLDKSKNIFSFCRDTHKSISWQVDALVQTVLIHTITL